MNIFKSTGIACFTVQHEGLNRIRKQGKPKLKQSALKLYLFLCSRKGGVEADAEAVFKRTGLTKNVLTRARTELIRLNMINAVFERGQGRTYECTVLNLQNGRPFDTTDNDGAAYCQVPGVVLFSSAFLQDRKVSSLVYASVLAECNR